jgi:hypothetical protein
MVFPDLLGDCVVSAGLEPHVVRPGFVNVHTSVVTESCGIGHERFDNELAARVGDGLRPARSRSPARLAL